MADTPKIISAFYSTKIQGRAPAATYIFGDSEAQTSNRASGDGSLIRERKINIWWEGASDEVFGLVTSQYPDAEPRGTITTDGELLLPPLSDDATPKKEKTLEEKRAFASLLRTVADPGAASGADNEKASDMLADFRYKAKIATPLPPRGRRLPEFNGNGIIPADGLADPTPEPLPDVTDDMRPANGSSGNVVSLFGKRNP